MLRGEALSFAILTVAFAFFAWRSWRTWPDILVDFGHELYIPWRLSEGEVLYKDILFTMGPLSQYANAFLFRLFGTSLMTLIGANLTILAVIVGLLFWLFRRCGALCSATFVNLFFLAVFAFAQVTLIGNYNYVCPYRHEITHGLALGLGELACLLRFAETNRTRWLIATGFCLGLVALTKVEMLLPAGVAAVVALPMMIRNGFGDRRLADSASSADDRSARGWIHDLVAAAIRFVAAAAVPIILAALALAVPLGWSGAIDGLSINGRLAVDPALTTNSGFYRTLAGWSAPGYGIERMVRGLAALLIVMTFGCLGDWFLSRFSRGRLLPAVVGLIAALAGLVTIRFPDLWSFVSAPLPVVLAAVLAPIAVRSLRGRLRSSAEMALGLMALYSLCLLPKILLAVGWGHYGFILAMPGTLVLIHVAVHSIPAWLRSRYGTGDYFRALTVGLVTACAIVQSFYWDRRCQAKTLAVGEGG
ncbi:MAG TPA: hypothetical protein VL475_09595, partial [Planctomycetaceae bacterium]|nr:hypothetical protein [Planctomycetaceae bacterium]